MRNPREYYGEALHELAKTEKNIIALDCDLCKSTMSVYMEQGLPDQYIEMGIAEANMVSTAAGLAADGKIPFCHTFAVFITGRAFDQIRQVVCIPNLPVKLIGSSAGLSDYGDGSTHQTVEDIAIMRSLPNMSVVVPGDALQCAKAVKAAVEWDGPVYVRITRSAMEDVSQEGDDFHIGKAYVIKEGTDITLMACGIMVDMALKASEILRKIGIFAGVVNVSTIKPIDKDMILIEALKTGKVLTIEEHSIIGGLGEAVASVLRMENVLIDFMGIEDSFGQSSNYLEPLMEQYKLTVEEIVKRVRQFYN
jgi:transketolase